MATEDRAIDSFIPVSYKWRVLLESAQYFLPIISNPKCEARLIKVTCSEKDIKTRSM